MITLKASGYNERDFKFLLIVLNKGMDFIQHQRCLTVDCEICKYYKACNDIWSLMNYLIKQRLDNR